MNKRLTFKMKKLHHYAKSGQPTRIYHGMKLSAETAKLLDRVENMTQFSEAAIMILAYLLGLTKWSDLAPVIAANLTDTQRRAMVSTARTLALNLEINEELEKTK